jgi:GNAT superfamily N-acetyltransferase
MNLTRVSNFYRDNDLREKVSTFNRDKWPEFMFHDPVADALWHHLIEDFGDFQFALVDDKGKIRAFANAIPFVWDGDPASLDDRGWDWVFEKGAADLLAGRKANALSALQAVVDPALRGTGTAARVLDEMRATARYAGLKYMVAPVRPTLKPAYPLVPMARYATWTRDDGAPFDPWLRAHWRVGARIIKPCNNSMLIEASVATWETWSNMKFADTGKYIVPGALTPIDIDVGSDSGIYIEPNVWMQHSI